MMWNVLGNRKSPTRRRVRSRLGRLVLEQLEERSLLSNNVSLVDGVWTIQGSLGTTGDNVVVDRNPNNLHVLRAVVNGEVRSQVASSDVGFLVVLTGAGNDIIRIDESIGVPAYIATGAGNDTVFSGGGDDGIEAGSGRDVVWGRGGNDYIDGGDGNDWLYGGFGGDALLGGAGNDHLVGNGTLGGPPANGSASDDDWLDGGAGNDVYNGSGGNDGLNIGPGDRVINGPTQFESETALREYLVQAGVQRFQYQFGRPVYGYGCGCAYLDGGILFTAAPDATTGPDFTGTTVQEEGVEEADLVKTDGQFIYAISNRQLVILNSFPATDLAVLSRTTIEGAPIAQFLMGNRVTILSTVQQCPIVLPVPPGDPTVAAPAAGEGGAALAVPFLPIIFPPVIYPPPQLKITVLDVSDRTSPQLVQETILDGSLISSRAIGDRVYVAVRNDFFQILQPEINTTDGTGSYFYETEEMYRARLQSAPLEQLLPGYQVRWSDGSGTFQETTGPISAAENIYQAVFPGNTSLVSVLAFNVGDGSVGPFDSVTIEAADSFNTTVYASTDNFYLLSYNYLTAATSIYRINLAGDDIELTASGEVPGQVNNQFSVDEEGPYLRVATNTFATGSVSNVYVLAAEGNILNVIGSVEELALGERIFSARFFGDRGYVVTFRQVDPLWTFDLSDPFLPRQVGELHITGFSRYLQPISDTLLLGIGRDADDTGRVRGLQISLFDVSDLANPTLLHRYTILDEAALPFGFSFSSTAEFDHHAVFFDQGVLAIPISGYRTFAAPAGTPSRYDSLLVIQVDGGTGFTLIGQAVHASPVLRSLRIEDALYSISRDTIQSRPLLDPSLLIAEVTYRSDEPVVYEVCPPIPFFPPFPIPFPFPIEILVIDAVGGLAEE